MALVNTSDVFYSNKDKEVIAKLHAEKEARDAAKAETVSTASTLAPSTQVLASPKTACGKVHSNNRPCDAPECKGVQLTTAQKLGRKLGFGRNESVDPKIAKARQELDNMSDAERQTLRDNIRNRPVQMDVGVVGGSGAFGGASAGGNSTWVSDEELLCIGKSQKSSSGLKQPNE